MSQTKDRLIRGTAIDGKVRAFAVRTTGLVEELRRRHDMYPTATAALGRTLTAGAMMGSMMKGKEKLTIQIKGDGPLGQILVDANALGEVRGYVNEPQAHLPNNSMGKPDVAGAVGTSGFLHVTKDLGMKEPYRGSVPIVSGEIGEDFTYYFAVSEQTPSAVGLGVRVESDASVIVAGGFIIQLLPGLEDEEITAIEQAVGQLPPVTSLLDQGLELEEMIKCILPDFKLLDEMDIKFACSCSRERVEKTLISLGETELTQLMEEDEETEVVCDFCRNAYVFNQDDIRTLLEQAKN
ncbi:molecular chaperone Hsp33 [Paenibacillus shirakamiensis]|uniref:33 kDa chaperonin n=1 Tax=Paenibacillus shirakamiensis TaxID=1265935 RepID=A0ABS4JLY3_9BACL|nr:Hsp33 family molecular chaperone HslO [Paenibacillus shirakamiensis]MBP2002727.1 molecular chaperone Hsp33 [Paenibacillus shirakamiensis]